MEDVLLRLDHIEQLLYKLTSALAPEESESDWVDSREFCRLVGLKDTKALTYQMSKGILRPDALRNIGTIKRPWYRFHRRLAVDQFLSRSA